MKPYEPPFVLSHSNRLRPAGVHVQEPDLLHQEDGGEVPGGSPERHPEPGSDVQLRPQAPHLAQRGCLSG